MWEREGGGGSGRTLIGGGHGYRGDLLFWVKLVPNIKGTDSSVHVASVRVLERHHPTMSILWGHGYRVKIMNYLRQFDEIIDTVIK